MLLSLTGPGGGATLGPLSTAVLTINTTTRGSASAVRRRSGTLTFGTNETSKTFTVPVHTNAGSAANKSVTLTLSSPSTGATLGAPSPATLRSVSD